MKKAITDLFVSLAVFALLVVFSWWYGSYDNVISDETIIVGVFLCGVAFITGPVFDLLYLLVVTVVKSIRKRIQK